MHYIYNTMYYIYEVIHKFKNFSVNIEKFQYYYHWWEYFS